MQYYYRHKTQDTRPGSTIFLNFLKYYLGKARKSVIFFIFNVFSQYVRSCCGSVLINTIKWSNSSLKNWLLLIQSLISYLFILSPQWLSKLPFVCIPLLSLYSFNTHGLSAHTAQTIQGSAPYLTFDDGKTRANTAKSLLFIKLSDGTTFTPENNTSTTEPIKLPKGGETFENINMVLDKSEYSHTLSDLVSKNRYWRDDDGDGENFLENNALTKGLNVTGNISLKITDKYNKEVTSRNTVLDICNAPYKLVLTSSSGTISTKYGDPNSSLFANDSATYYVNPKSDPIICYARPSLNLSEAPYAGPEWEWQPKNGFLINSNYNLNFPTTGANGMYFDLEIGGSFPLTWPTVTKDGITATITQTPDVPAGTRVRVTLTGPVATKNQIGSDLPGAAGLPGFREMELVGVNDKGKEVVKYGFRIKQWFVNRGGKTANFAEAESWCRSLGYRLPRVKDLTNANCVPAPDSHFCTGAEGATPLSDGNYYQRRINAGFFSEWGDPVGYSGTGFVYDSYHTSDESVGGPYNYNAVYPHFGSVDNSFPIERRSVVCTYP